MVGMKIGLDIGTGYVTAAVESRGIVLSEPAVLALERETGRVLAAGKKAEVMTGRCPEAIKLAKPLLSGDISDFENAEVLLRVYLNRICKNKVFRPTVAASMPAGLTNLEKRTVLGCLLRAGAGRAAVLEEPLAAALGTGVMLDKPYGTMIVSIGAGTTGIAVITMGNIAVSKSIKVGGDDMDHRIKDFLKINRNIAVGDLTAEELKKMLGSAVKRSETIAAVTKGKGLSDGMPLYFEVTSEEIHFAIRSCLEEIANAIKSVLEITPPELVRDIIDSGILLCGGVANLYGLDKFLSENTGIEVKLPGNNMNLAALGALRALCENNFLAENGYPFVTLETLTNGD